MKNNTIKIVQSIAMIVIFATVIAGGLLLGTNQYIDYVGNQIKERKILAQELHDHMEEKSNISDNYEDALANFKAKNPGIEESAAYWIHKLIAFEAKKDSIKSSQVYKAAIDRLEPNDLRLFLLVTKIMPQKRGAEYVYENASGKNVDLKGCYDELEGDYKHLIEGVKKDNTMMASLALMNYFMFPDIFTEDCSQLRTVKK